MVGSNENLTQEYGEDQLAEDNGGKAGYWGWPKTTTHQDMDKVNPGYDPNMWCQHREDGGFWRVAYGKNPSEAERTVHGYHSWIVGNGNRFEYHPSSYHAMHKGDTNHHHNGSHDQLVHNVGRYNHGTDQGGGHYTDAGKGGSVHGSGGDEKGGRGHYSDGSMNVATAQHYKVTAAKSFTMGRGDDGGEHQAYVHMSEKGDISIVTKGQNISIQADKGGSIKIAGKSDVSISSEGGKLTLGSKDSPTSIHGSTINLGARDDIKASHPLPGPAPIKTTYGQERGIHSGAYNNLASGGTGPEIT
ncbi:MAG TPA: hypothetical protein VEP90_26340 [Methylomirabilota bacterium]|nr:hypothetical protein [Methylomirabilota bacterium]